MWQRLGHAESSVSLCMRLRMWSLFLLGLSGCATRTDRCQKRHMEREVSALDDIGSTQCALGFLCWLGILSCVVCCMLSRSSAARACEDDDDKNRVTSTSKETAGVFTLQKRASLKREARKSVGESTKPASHVPDASMQLDKPIKQAPVSNDVSEPTKPTPVWKDVNEPTKQTHVSEDVNEPTKETPVSNDVSDPTCEKPHDLASESSSGRLAHLDADVDRMIQMEKKVGESDHQNEVAKSDDDIFEPFTLERYKRIAWSCFEHDWNLIQPELDEFEYFENEENALKECVRTRYIWIVPLYLKLSTNDLSAAGSTPDDISAFGVSDRSVLRLFGEEDGIDIIEAPELTREIAEELYAGALFYKVKHKFATHFNERLARFQFTEFLMRSAFAKYPPAVCTRVEAINKFFERLAPVCWQCSDEFQSLSRSGSSDAVRRTFKAIRRQTYGVFCERAAKSGKHGSDDFVMTLSAWRKLLDDMTVYTFFPSVSRRLAAYMYRMGLEIQADEQYNTSWQLMDYAAFQRALGALYFLAESRANGTCSAEKLASLLSEQSKTSLSRIAEPKTYHPPK
eukprot:TRINITY_DN25807_c0_g1_i1.p1 TRINITY_DN25807_c0_g1~~TRINITY_DN25807_c0_g1_i1.p1  ORF type:complete len:569 (-),score=76.79 TRINITY_DN25807_c0_g1_i1:160-1866(-)